MRFRSAGVARPVRTAPSSSWSTPMAPFIFLVASASADSTVTGSPFGASLLRPVHERPDGLAGEDAPDVAVAPIVEHEDGKAIVATQGDGRGVHHLEPAGQHLRVLDRLELVRSRMSGRIGVVD